MLWVLVVQGFASDLPANSVDRANAEGFPGLVFAVSLSCMQACKTKQYIYKRADFFVDQNYPQ